MPIEGDLERVLGDARTDASMRREPLTTAHLLRYLLTAGTVRAAVAATGVSPDALMRATNAQLDRGIDEEATAVEAALQRATRRIAAAGRTLLRATDVLIALCEEPSCVASALIAEHGITPLALKLHVSHPAAKPSGLRGLIRKLTAWRAPDAVTSAASESVQVLMHNDEFTTQAFVVQVLEQAFAIPHARAEVLMRVVHTTGVASVATLPPDAAHSLIDEVTRLAREQGYPLRLTVEPRPAELPRAELRRG